MLDRDPAWNLLHGCRNLLHVEFAAGPRFKSGVVLEQEIKEANAECPQPSQKARVTRDICTGRRTEKEHDGIGWRRKSVS